tara:strand:- start:261 stop:608 length:348 start_codon:yes stop_codon:yes gene_type:complete
MSYYKEERPWGSFENIFESHQCKVKKIIVKPSHKTSYQYHFKRSEQWTVVQGEAVITIDGKDIQSTVGGVIDVPVEVKHRVFNNGLVDFIFIEVQRGTYFGEDDIVRVNDDYGRQ